MALQQRIQAYFGAEKGIGIVQVQCVAPVGGSKPQS